MDRRVPSPILGRTNRYYKLLPHHHQYGLHSLFITIMGVTHYKSDVGGSSHLRLLNGLRLRPYLTRELFRVTVELRNETFQVDKSYVGY